MTFPCNLQKDWIGRRDVAKNIERKFVQRHNRFAFAMNAVLNATVEFTLRCEASAAYGRRFGAELAGLHIAAPEAIINLTIRVPPEIDRRNRAVRLGRHWPVLPDLMEDTA